MMQMPYSGSACSGFKLRDLQFLTLAAETGSMGKAAQLLNTSQPAVSHVAPDFALFPDEFEA